MKAMSMLAVATVVLALPLAAQQPRGMGQGTMHGRGMQGGMMQGGMMQGMDSMMAPMMRAMAFAPAHLLAQKQALHLTDDQVSQLTALRDGAKSAHDAAAQQAMMHMGELEQTMQAPAPDTSAVKMHFDAAHRLMGDAMWAMMRSAAQARGVLTDFQRGQVEGMAKRPMARMRHGGMGQH